MRSVFRLVGLFVVVSFGVCALAASPCLAEDKKHDGKKHEGKEDHKPIKIEAHIHDHETGKHITKEYDLSLKEAEDEFIRRIRSGEVTQMHRKDPPTPLKLEAELAIWSIVVFVLLLIVLRKLAWGPMVEGLQKREASIRSAVDEAKLARQETEELRTRFKKEMDEAFAKIPQMMEEARRDGERLVEDMRSKAHAEVTADRERLRREIEMARDQALQELWNQAAQLATLMSAKAIGRSISEEDHRRLLDEALSELGESRKA